MATLSRLIALASLLALSISMKANAAEDCNPSHHSSPSSLPE